MEFGKGFADWKAVCKVQNLPGRPNGNNVFKFKTPNCMKPSVFKRVLNIQYHDLRLAAKFKGSNSRMRLERKYIRSRPSITEFILSVVN